MRLTSQIYSSRKETELVRMTAVFAWTKTFCKSSGTQIFNLATLHGHHKRLKKFMHPMKMTLSLSSISQLTNREAKANHTQKVPNMITAAPPNQHPPQTLLQGKSQHRGSGATLMGAGMPWLRRERFKARSGRASRGLPCLAQVFSLTRKAAQASQGTKM